MNHIKLFFGFMFIGKIDDVTVVEGYHHIEIYEVYNILVSGLFSVWYTTGPYIVQYVGTYHTSKLYLAYFTCYISQFRA